MNLEPRLSPDGTPAVRVSTERTGHFDLCVAEIGEQGLTHARHLVAPRESKIDRYYYSTFDHAINRELERATASACSTSAIRKSPGAAATSGRFQSSDPADRRRVLVDETTWAARPELSPDGKRLLYSTYQGRQWHQLWVTTPDGGSPLPLTFGEFDRRNARWSPDGNARALRQQRDRQHDAVGAGCSPAAHACGHGARAAIPPPHGDASRSRCATSVASRWRVA